MIATKSPIWVEEKSFYNVWYSSDKLAIILAVGGEHDIFRFANKNSYFINRQTCGINIKIATRLYKDLEETYPADAPKENLILIATNTAEADVLKQVFWHGQSSQPRNCPKIVVTHSSSLANEITFNITNKNEVDRPFNMLVTARPVKMKRWHLTGNIDNICYVQRNDNSFDLLKEHQKNPFCSCPQTIYCTKCADIAYSPFPFSNCTLLKKDIPQQEINELCNQSLCGGIFSESEGGCYSSIEYLLSGLPVLSTFSDGGRDLFYTPDNSVLVCPTTEDVEKGWKTVVTKLKNGQFDRQKIREDALEKSKIYRNEFINVIADIFEEKQIDTDPERYFYSIRNSWKPVHQTPAKGIHALSRCMF